MSYTYTYGSGTEEDPYQVWTADDLEGARDHLDAHFIQMADIDLSHIDNWEEIGWGLNWAFTGSYNGNNYTISNLTFYHEYNYTGLFGSVNNDSESLSILKNIRIINAHISTNGTSYNAILVGRCQTNVLVENCFVQGIVENVADWDATYGGGLIGYYYGHYPIEGGNIRKCAALVELINYNFYAGGLIGLYEYGENYGSGTVSNCYSRGNITYRETANSVGGLIGGMGFSAGNSPGSCFVENCYSACSLLSGSNGLIGKFHDGQDINVTNCYFDAELSGQTDDHATPKTTAEMIYPYSDPDNVYIDWDFHTVWAHDKGGSA